MISHPVAGVDGPRTRPARGDIFLFLSVRSLFASYAAARLAAPTQKWGAIAAHVSSSSSSASRSSNGIGALPAAGAAADGAVNYAYVTTHAGATRTPTQQQQL
ncbi:hypothetical protein niasHT_024374 [Heterodera trifolii]|uniref:Uncharacterized protein n=1 Tax=Heterodera trifolii TaxID=157864 RepID=A0ABD2JY91_9BILA